MPLSGETATHCPSLRQDTLLQTSELHISEKIYLFVEYFTFETNILKAIKY